MKYAMGIVLACVLFAAAPALAGGADIFAKSCKGCHGVDGAKVGMGMTKPLQGMPLEEIQAALAGYKAGTYGGEKKTLMERVVKPLSDDEIQALAAYSASL
jgi:cytochrome c